MRKAFYVSLAVLVLGLCGVVLTRVAPMLLADFFGLRGWSQLYANFVSGLFVVVGGMAVIITLVNLALDVRHDDDPP